MGKPDDWLYLHKAVVCKLMHVDFVYTIKQAMVPHNYEVNIANNQLIVLKKLLWGKLLPYGSLKEIERF